MPVRTADDAGLGVLTQVVLTVAPFAELWLREKFVILTVVLSLGAMIEAWSVGSAPWAVAGLLAVTGVATALIGPLLRPWRPSRTWLIMLTTAAFDLGVILLLAPP